MPERIPCRVQSPSIVLQSPVLVVRNDPASYCRGTKLDLALAGYVLDSTPTLSVGQFSQPTVGVLFFFNPHEPLEALLAEWETIPRDHPTMAVAIGGPPPPELLQRFGDCPLFVSEYGPSLHQVLAILNGWQAVPSPN